MNERILELYRQAQVPHTAIDPSNNMPYETTIFSAEKFAELMVEEFDLILANEYLDCVGENDKKSQFRVARLRKRVEEYFGVEE